MADYYIQNPELLLDQPKRTIADYVEQNGILVPRRFDSLKEARSAKNPFLRSEHPQEYDGISGLLDSFSLNDTLYLERSDPNDAGLSLNGKETLEDIKAAYFNKLKRKRININIRRYCDYTNISEEVFESEVSFSLWEKLSGYNRAVIADSAIPNKYHIMTNKGCSFSNYTILENGTISQFIEPLPEDLLKRLPSLIETYEAVRNLSRFDSKHCPIMEFQTVDGKDYFLQYHRTRDFASAEFTLERNPQDGENLKITVYYHDQGSGRFSLNFHPEDEDGSFDLHQNNIFSELQVKKRKLQVEESENLHIFEGLAIGHDQRSKMFKPMVSAVFPINKVLKDHEVLLGDQGNVVYGNGQRYHPRDPILKDEEIIFNYYKETKKQGSNTYINLHLVSDGRRAFVKRI